MDAKELRVGNLVKCHFKCDSEWFESEVISIYDNSHLKVVTNGIFDDIHIENTKPIELTINILNKIYEFENSEGYCKDIELGAIEFYIDYDNELVCELYDKRVQIKYLNQLQNLFFLLTGKELTINL